MRIYRLTRCVYSINKSGENRHFCGRNLGLLTIWAARSFFSVSSGKKERTCMRTKRFSLSRGTSHEKERTPIPVTNTSVPDGNYFVTQFLALFFGKSLQNCD